MSDFRFYTTHAYMHFFTDDSLLSAILFISCWFFCILILYNAYICFRMHLHINEAGIFAIEKKTDSENAKWPLFSSRCPFAVTRQNPLRRWWKEFLLFIYVRKRGIRQTVIYTLLGADDPQACVRTEEGATRCCNIRPRCINVKDRLGQTASFESGFSFLNPDLKNAAQSPGGPDVRFVHKSNLRMRPIQRQRVLFPSY